MDCDGVVLVVRDVGWGGGRGADEFARGLSAERVFVNKCTGGKRKGSIEGKERGSRYPLVQRSGSRCRPL